MIISVQKGINNTSENRGETVNAIEIAIRMEKDAIDFYSAAAEKTKNPVGKKMFLSIKEDEKRHLQTLSQIFKDVGIKMDEVSPMRNMKTIFESMKSVMMQKVQATPDELESFKIAMQMEKEGIEFYKKAEAGARTEKEKALFERLIKEEQQHHDISFERFVNFPRCDYCNETD